MANHSRAISAAAQPCTARPRSQDVGLVTQRVSGANRLMAIYQMVFAKLAAIGRLIDGGGGSAALDDEDVDLLILSADCGADTTLATAIAVFVADINAYRIGRRTQETASYSS